MMMNVRDQNNVQDLLHRVTTTKDALPLSMNEFNELCHQLYEYLLLLENGGGDDDTCHDTSTLQSLLEIITTLADNNNNNDDDSGNSGDTYQKALSHHHHQLFMKLIDQMLSQINVNQDATVYLLTVKDNWLFFLECYTLLAFALLEQRSEKCQKLERLFSVAVRGEFGDVLLKVFLKQQIYEQLIYSSYSRELFDIFLRLYNHGEITEAQTDDFLHWLFHWECVMSDRAGFKILHWTDLQYLIDVKLRNVQSALETPKHYDPSLLDMLTEMIAQCVIMCTTSDGERHQSHEVDDDNGSRGQSRDSVVSAESLYRFDEMEHLCKEWLNDCDDSRFKSEQDFILWKEKARLVLDVIVDTRKNVLSSI